MPLPSQEQITEKLRAVIDPELRRSIVELGMVRSIEVKDDGRVEVVVSLTTAGCPIRSHFEQAVAQQVSELDGVTSVAVGFDVLSDEEKGNLQQTLGRAKLPEGALAQVKNVICVASGKGGVGKSTMTANLAAALTAEGHAAGALDCDVYGYSIPRMLGVNRKPEVNAERKILPLDGAGGVKVMSIGFFVEENSAVVWRGPMLHKAIQQFLEDVAWDDLDYLLLDLPPGTGDVSMTLAQLLPQSKIVIVTTPQPAAQSVAALSADLPPAPGRTRTQPPSLPTSRRPPPATDRFIVVWLMCRMRRALTAASSSPHACWYSRPPTSTSATRTTSGRACRACGCCPRCTSAARCAGSATCPRRAAC